MGDSLLFCNINQCRRPIVDTAWVTRCMHVFCPDHGRACFGGENSAQVACPACNEINAKETDVATCELNPNDMVLCGLSPQKTIGMAVKSLKLWWYQSEQERQFGMTRLEKLDKKLTETKHAYEKVLNKLQMKLQSEIDSLKNCYKEAVEREKRTREELEEARNSLRKYQIAYNSMVIGKHTKHHSDRAGGGGPLNPSPTPDWPGRPHDPNSLSPNFLQPATTSVAFSPSEMTSKYFKRDNEIPIDSTLYWDRFSI